MPTYMGDALLRMASRRRLERAHIVGGESIDPAEWLTQQHHPWELLRAEAMGAWVSLRRGYDVVEPAERVAETRLIGESAKPLTERALRDWLAKFILAGGRLKLSQRGHHAKIESYLDNQKLRHEAVQWLRTNVQAGRKKSVSKAHPTPPLNVPRFHKYVNETLLKDVLSQPGKRGQKLKPIDERSACRWLHTLGFKYCSHKKNIYFDGHERLDVVTDRMEKLVMFEVRHSPPQPLGPTAPQP
jgi:hypothetical protein